MLFVFNFFTFEYVLSFWEDKVNSPVWEKEIIRGINEWLKKWLYIEF